MKRNEELPKEQPNLNERRARQPGPDQSKSKNGDASSPPAFAKKLVSNRKLSSLRTYPKQQAMFADMSGDDLARLAKSMKRGLDEPVEILPNGTIISGHQRGTGSQAARVGGHSLLGPA